MENSIFILFCLALLFTKNGYNAIDDLRTKRAHEYNAQMISRYELMKNTNDTVYFKPIKNKPKTLFVLDITDDPAHWQNRVYNVFFEKPNKVVKPNLETR